MIGLFGPPPAVPRFSPLKVFVFGWAAVIFFGVTGLLLVKLFFDTHEQLRIGKAGIRWSRWSDQIIPWLEISRITTWSSKGQNFIVLHLRNPELFPGRGVLNILSRANSALTGGDICISLTGTDRSFEEAMSAITRLRS
jgi:hypothetical protein